jgi:hypothetical protein
MLEEEEPMACSFGTKVVELDADTWRAIEYQVKQILEAAGKQVPDTLVQLSAAADAYGGGIVYQYHNAEQTETTFLDEKLTSFHRTSAVQSVSSIYYYCKTLSTGKYWFRCCIIDGREICSNTGIRCS